MVSDAPKHYPVLLNEIISIITPQHGGTFIDCTFGQGGYTKKILSFNKLIQSLGGLYIIGTERHESRRIDDQLRGRCGRQGDPGDHFGPDGEQPGTVPPRGLRRVATRERGRVGPVAEGEADCQTSAGKGARPREPGERRSLARCDAREPSP